MGHDKCAYRPSIDESGRCRKMVVPDVNKKSLAEGSYSGEEEETPGEKKKKIPTETHEKNKRYPKKPPTDLAPSAPYRRPDDYKTQGRESKS